MRRVRRRLGTALLIVGVLALGYGAAVYFWKDPVTDLYTSWKQRGLAGQLEQSFAEYRGSEGLPVGNESPLVSTSASTASAPTTTTPLEVPAQPSLTADADEPAAVMAAQTRRSAETFLEAIEPGEPIGRITIPRLGIDPVFINGTTSGDLREGPGRYPETKVPGLGELTAIAGHRTTFGAPFRHVDSLKRGDEIVVELPYGTFTYRVTGHEIVDDEDWSIIEPRGYDTLVLSACHPLYSAEQRYIVYAKLARVDLPDGESYREPAGQAATSG